MSTEKKSKVHKRYGMKMSILASLMALTLLLTGCPAMSDWQYNNLPGEYSIWRINIQDIQLVKVNGNSGDPVVGRYIIAFCYSDRYIGLQRIPLEREYDGVIDVENLDKSNPEFYLIDAEIGSVFGPWTKEEYLDNITELGITEMCEWIFTDSKPVDPGKNQ